MTKHTARLRVRRGTADEPQPRYEEFTLPFEAGTTVLDALIAIRRQHDPSRAIRYSCINANVCKECLIAIDGVVDYPCTTRLLDAQALMLCSLPGRPPLGDLVTGTL